LGYNVGPMDLEGLFKACADGTRLRLINLLVGGEVCVCDLVKVLGTNQPKVSRHLARLKRAGLVRDRKEGLWVYYGLAVPPAGDAGRILACLGSCFADSAEMRSDLARLAEVRAARPIIPPTPATAAGLEVELL
jgi:ArsR family transcriptional regulator, arsenate/arsenite/antimonite-responsive transcriptional repressor